MVSKLLRDAADFKIQLLVEQWKGYEMKKLDQTLADRETSYHRRDDCGSYDRCLVQAAIKRWPSFSCMECRDYKRENPLVPRLRRASSLAGETR